MATASETGAVSHARSEAMVSGEAQATSGAIGRAAHGESVAADATTGTAPDRLCGGRSATAVVGEGETEARASAREVEAASESESETTIEPTACPQPALAAALALHDLHETAASRGHLPPALDPRLAASARPRTTTRPTWR